MDQLEKAREAVEKMRADGGKGDTYRVIAESLYSIAISLDAKNTADREARESAIKRNDDQREEERKMMAESNKHAERVIKQMEEIQEIQRKNANPKEECAEADEASKEDVEYINISLRDDSVG